MSTLNDAFTPPQEQWQRISPKYASARRLALFFGLVVLMLPLIGVALVAPTPGPTIAVIGMTVLVVVYVWLFWLVGRQVRAYGFAEREEDLIVTSGVMFKRLVIVPYGRMQLVDLAAGPIDRLFGVTTVQLHTAAATTDASIPGLLPDVAAGVRDRLASLGEHRTAGL